MSNLLEFDVQDGVQTYKAHVYEGEYSELITGGVNRKYTHHLVEMVREIREDKSFKHLSTFQICEAISQYGVVRGFGWQRVYGQVAKIMAKKEATEYDPDSTRKNIARHMGVSCWLCGSVIKKDRLDDFFSLPQSWSREIAWLFNQPYDIVCEACLKVSAPTMAFHCDTYRLGALSGLVRYLRHEINKIDPPKKKRKQ